MIFLIGTNHEYQLEGYSNRWESFYNFLSEKAEELGADLLAEEMSEEGIARHRPKYPVKDSVARRIAREQGRRHLFVDLDSNERKRCGIKGFNEIAVEFGYGPILKGWQTKQVERIEKVHWKKRELCWLNRLLKTDFKICILVIGADHIERFSDLLQGRQIEHSVLVADYET